MAKVHKTLRIEEALAERVKEAKREGESEAAAYARLVEAALDAPKATGQESDSSALVSALQANIDDLRQQVAVKDGQISELQAITKAAQTLHGVSEAAHVKQLDGGEERGRFSRAWAVLTGKDKD